MGITTLFRTRSTTPLMMIAVLAWLGGTQAAHAESVYKCRDAEGRVAYQDHACATTQRETLIEIAPAPPPSPAPDYGVSAKSPAGARRGSSHVGARGSEALSYECRADNGEVFYQHTACPKSISTARAGGHGRASRGSGTEKVGVSAIALPRADVCRRLAAAGSIGRAGRERDARVSTYERNAGRDPCRRY